MNKEELHQLLHPMKVIGLGGNPALNEKNCGNLTPTIDRNCGSPL